MSKDKPLDAGRPAMAGHSPGPWSWGAGAGKWVLTDANGKPMLSFSEWSIEKGDMPLIAAAPEMAEMLRHAVEVINEVQRDQIRAVGGGNLLLYHLESRLASLLGRLA